MENNFLHGKESLTYYRQISVNIWIIDLDIYSRLVKLRLQLLCHTPDGAIRNRSNTEIHLGRNTHCSSLVPQ